MGSLFKSPQPVVMPAPAAAAAPPPLPTPTEAEAPRYRRMPVETDPAIIAAGMRTREAAFKRKGRLSTILTDQTRDITGSRDLAASSGVKLGA